MSNHFETIIKTIREASEAHNWEEETEQEGSTRRFMKNYAGLSLAGRLASALHGYLGNANKNWSNAMTRMEDALRNDPEVINHGTLRAIADAEQQSSLKALVEAALDEMKDVYQEASGEVWMPYHEREKQGGKVADKDKKEAMAAVKRMRAAAKQAKTG